MAMLGLWIGELWIQHNLNQNPGSFCVRSNELYLIFMWKQSEARIAMTCVGVGMGVDKSLKIKNVKRKREYTKGTKGSGSTCT